MQNGWDGKWLSNGRMLFMNSNDMESNRSIVIEKGKERADHWEFEVRVGDRSYEVLVEKGYAKKLTKEKISPRDLVMYSFLFLLEREPATAILPSFNLNQIPTYFPEYETAMEFLINR